MTAKPFGIVVACCDKLGIGTAGLLPWNLKLDMQHFRKLTCNSIEGKRNAVIMGRKTYFSIPEKFRPLKNRINVVMSRAEFLDVPEGVHHAKNFHSALEILSSTQIVDSIDKVYVIGGSAVYQEAFNSPRLQRIYLTRVYKSLECDVFLPKVSLPNFRRIQVDGITTEMLQENGMEFEFQIYERVDDPDEKISMVCAMSSNRGIGYEGRLPWPQLPTDYEYYTSLSSPAKCIQPGGVVGHIKGRLTHESRLRLNVETERTGIVDIIISSDPSKIPKTEPFSVVPNLEAALKLCRATDKLESVFIMGGGRVYQAALSTPECSRIYLTEIEKDFPADAFFPKFEHLFKRVSEGKTITENGCSYKFNIYERKSFADLVAEDTMGNGSVEPKAS